MLDSKNPSARASVYDDSAILKLFPMAPLIRDSIGSAGPRPVTPFYTDVSGSVQRSWHPPSSVRDPATPKKSASLMTDILKGDRLL
jgi:multiple sugar transport system substrate-binding protein